MEPVRIAEAIAVFLKDIEMPEGAGVGPQLKVHHLSEGEAYTLAGHLMARLNLTEEAPIALERLGGEDSHWLTLRIGWDAVASFFFRPNKGGSRDE